MDIIAKIYKRKLLKLLGSTLFGYKTIDFYFEDNLLIVKFKDLKKNIIEYRISDCECYFIWDNDVNINTFDDDKNPSGLPPEILKQEQNTYNLCKEFYDNRR